jgi:FADH2 O2-dependent halogenase
MEQRDVDIVVVGSGFAGSLLANILTRIGRSVLVIDRGEHPRFAIGESSTPTANLVLGDLVRRYQLDAIEPLVRYGSWQSHYPEIGCGLKRGFSYFQHQAGREFQAMADHGNELMVAASSTDELADTHWLRADVDSFLARQMERAGAELWPCSQVKRLEKNPSGHGWRLAVESGGESREVAARFLVDASGAGQWLPGSLQLEDVTHRLQTHSHALFSHFRGVASWHDLLTSQGAAIGDHPFHCDHAAQHHLLDGAWMWILGFQGGLTSAGIAFDPGRHPVEKSWQQWLDSYPSLARIFAAARLADQPGQLVCRGRLQRLVTPASGPGWALLPHTAGFIDPLHSTGIAHSLSAIEQLAGMLEEHWDRESLVPQLAGYSRRLERELALIDRLVAGCYRGLGQVDLFRSFSMLYFAAATNYEIARLHDRNPLPAFLCAEDESLSRIVDRMLAIVDRLAKQIDPSAAEISSFQETVARAIEPYNHVGLCDSTLQHMYLHTVAG